LKDDMARIIAMVEEGKMNAAEASEMICALKSESGQSNPPQITVPARC